MVQDARNRSDYTVRDRSAFDLYYQVERRRRRVLVVVAAVVGFFGLLGAIFAMASTFAIASG